MHFNVHVHISKIVVAPIIKKLLLLFIAALRSGDIITNEVHPRCDYW